MGATDAAPRRGTGRRIRDTASLDYVRVTRIQVLRER